MKRARSKRSFSALQREFLLWLDRNSARFSHQPLAMRASDGSLRFTFAGVNRILCGQLSSNGFFVEVHAKDFWDALVWVDAYPRESEEGFYDPDFLPEYRRYYKTAADFRDAEIFEALLE